MGSENYDNYDTAAGYAPPAESPAASRSSKGSVVFAILLLLFEVLFCLITGILYRLRHDVLTTTNDFGGVLLVCILTILALIGFGLINSYISRSSRSALAYSLIVFALGVQAFYLFRVFWEKAGNFYYSDRFRGQERFTKVGLSNMGNDREAGPESIFTAPFGEAIACAIALVIALGPVIGRTKLLPLFFFSIIGAAAYECNSQLVWRWFITDNAFGFRVILFGGVYGLICSVLLGNKDKTREHINHFSDYKQMSIALLGFLLVWICYPFLGVLTIFTYTAGDSVVLYAVAINMYLAMAASVLGSFTASSFLFKRLSMNELIFTGTAGAFAYAASADINFNPATPLACGYIVSFLCTVINNVLNTKLNRNGVLTSLPHIQRFVIPGILAGITSAIVQAIAKQSNGAYGPNADFPNRNSAQQAGEQLLGILVTIGFALVAGIISGVAMKIVNKRLESEDHFNDLAIMKTHDA